MTLEKFGFVFEGRLRHHAIINGSYADSLLHGLLMKDYVEK